MDWRVETLKDVEADDPRQIFHVDHAWTFRTDQARQQLTQVPGLASRMAVQDRAVQEDKSCMYVKFTQHVTTHFIEYN